MNILIANFAIDKWYKGHVKEHKVVRIDDPLVWRHLWVEETQSVLVQYKYSLADEGSFERDEWGPWVEKAVHIEEPVGSGTYVVKTSSRGHGPPPERRRGVI